LTPATAFISMRPSYLFLVVISLSLASDPASGKDRWNELNIGPFYIDYRSQPEAAREALDQLEQTRWVLGGLLESKDLPSLWPIHVVLIKDAKTNPAGFVRRQTLSNDSETEAAGFVPQNGRLICVLAPGQRLPLGQVAGTLLDANTPRLPAEAESGLRQLFASLEAKGSKVSWGGSVPHPDLAWARMQLFATKFEYGLSFHIFISALKTGSSIRVAERNAFGKDPDVLEKEAAVNLAQGHWEATSVSGRPLDPKRDFGEHTIDGAVVDAYLADAELDSDPKAAEAAYKAAVESGGEAMPLGYQGLAALAVRGKQDPNAFLEDAVRAGSASAPVYVDLAKNKSTDEALTLLKKASQLNPLWAEPIYAEAQLTEDAQQKEALLKKAVQLEPRVTRYWVELAQLQTTDGHALSAQASWLQAEDSAGTESERQKIHQQRLDSEQQRLNAAEAERRRERDAAHLENQRALDAETARIRAAEEKANQRTSAEAEETKPENVVPWEDTVPKRKLVGRLTRVECLKRGQRITVQDARGQMVLLFLAKTDAGTLACGPQQPSPKVTISYAAEPDQDLRTAGRVLTLSTQ
jgi:hypothetical protein